MADPHITFTIATFLADNLPFGVYGFFAGLGNLLYHLPRSKNNYQTVCDSLLIWVICFAGGSGFSTAFHIPDFLVGLVCVGGGLCGVSAIRSAFLMRLKASYMPKKDSEKEDD